MGGLADWRAGGRRFRVHLGRAAHRSHRPRARRPARPPWSLLGLALLLARPAAAQDQIGLPLGTAAPAVTLEDLNGNAVDLSQWIGKKPVLLEFWATWCPLCKALLPRMEAAHAAHEDEVQFLIVAVGVNQSPRSIRRYMEKQPLPGTVLWDGKGAAVRAFDAPTTSYIVVLDKTGKVVYTGAGEDQDVEAAVGKATG